MSEPGKSRAELIAELKQQPKPNLGPPAAAQAGVSPNSTTSSWSELNTPLDPEQRWQYAIVNIGTFNNADRMRGVLSNAGHAGWELVTIYDKSSNWVGGWEKGFMLLKRPVPPGTTPSKWCLLIRS